MVIVAGAAAGVVTGVAGVTETFRRHRAGQRAAAGVAAAVSLVGERPLAGRPAAAPGASGGGTEGRTERKMKTSTTSVSRGRRCTKGTRRLAEQGWWRDLLAPPRKALAVAGEEGRCISFGHGEAVGVSCDDAVQ